MKNATKRSFKGNLVRAAFTVADRIRDSRQTIPSGIAIKKDLVYGIEPWQTMDVYMPQGHMLEVSLRQGHMPQVNLPGDATGLSLGFPVLINVHGGGWVYGTKEDFKYYCMHLATHGFAVVNFNYGLAPEHKFPSQIEDIEAVVEWVLREGAGHGLDPERIFMVGDSAGAHLTTIYAGSGSHKPKAVALNCGVFDIQKASKPGMFSFRSLVRDLMPENDIPPNAISPHAISANAISHVNEGYPPVFLMTSTGDFLKEQSFMLREKLGEENIPHMFKVCGSKTKLLFHVFHLDMDMKESRKCAKDMCDYFKSCK